MRIGVVSDTHNQVTNVGRIVELFRAAAVEQIVHTGDITQPKVLDVLAKVELPVVGVFGNNDLGERERLVDAATRHGMELVDPPHSIVLHERRIAVVHDPNEIEVRLEAEHDVVLHGHTHRLREERRQGRLIFNPGECAGHLPGLNAVGVLDLEDLGIELLRF